MMPTRFSMALVAASLLVPALAQAVSVSQASTVKPGSVIDIASVKPLFKNKSRAVIAGYQVAFVVHNKATANATNVFGSGTAKASMEVQLANVDYALMQRIADEAYANFVKKVQEAGIEVVAPEQVKASANFQALETTPSSAQGPYTVNFQGADYVIVPASGFPLWFNKFDGLGAKGKASSRNVKAMADLSKEFDAAVLAPSFAVDFAYLDSSGGMLARRASVEVSNNMAIVPAATVYWGSTDGLVYPKFKDGFWAEGATGTFVRGASSNNRALVKGFAGLGMNIGPAASKSAMTLEADPEAFRTKTVELLDGAAEIFKRAVQDVRK